MAVYLVLEIEVLDRDGYAEFVDKVSATVESFGGRYLVRGGRVTPIAGGWAPERIVIIEFPTAERLGAWATSPEYRAIAPLRERSTRARVIQLEGV